MTRKPAALALVAALVSLSACSTSSPASVSSQPPVSASAPASQASTDAAADTPSPSASADLTAKFGQTITYDDGLAVSVVKVSTFKYDPNFAEGASIDKKDVGVRVLVQVRNGTKTTFDPSGLTVGLSAGPDGVDSDSMCQENGCFIEHKIPAGKAATEPWEFPVAPARLSDIQIEISPDFGTHDTATFTGSLKK